MKTYDLIVVGAGPAGLTAGIYAGRAMLDTLVIEQGQDGGQILQTAEIENYPGSDTVESGATLVDKMTTQVAKFGIEKIYDTVKDVHLDGTIKSVICERATYQARTVIIAGGATARPLGCVGEDKFFGRGLSHCGTCDGPFFRGLEVFVVGGGDTALEEAVYLTRFVKKVNLVHRRDEFRAAKSIQDKALKNEKITVLYNTVIKEIKGADFIETVVLENVKDGTITERNAEAQNGGTFGVFVFTGYNPATALYQDKLNISEQGYLITDEDMKTNIPGVYAAGDIREKTLRQVVTAAADGAIAAVQAEKYIDALKDAEQ